MTKDRKPPPKRRKLKASQTAKADHRSVRSPHKPADRAQAPKFFTAHEVAESLGVCRRTVGRWIAKGRLRVHRFGETVRIAEIDFLAFLAAHQE
jgi:excisionase family DNA binding protein